MNGATTDDAKAREIRERHEGDAALYAVHPLMPVQTSHYDRGYLLDLLAQRTQELDDEHMHFLNVDVRMVEAQQERDMLAEITITSAKAYDQVCEERDEARKFGEQAAKQYNNLLAQSSLVTCAFCGKEYPMGTPRHGDGALAEHVKTCEKHPMRELEAQLASSQQEVERLKADVDSLISIAHDAQIIPSLRERADRAEADRNEVRDALVVELQSGSRERLSLVVEALKQLKGMPWMQGRLDNSDRLITMERLDALLALAEGPVPHPVCETCGGTREVHTGHVSGGIALTAPCPDCAEGKKEQPK